jgi:hypothetical protein
MASLERLRAIRELELLVFGGVPEGPEPMFDRDGNPQAESRVTGRALGGGRYPAVETHRPTEFIEFDPETGEVRLVTVSQEGIESD